MLKAINIKWDTDGDEKVLQDLPTEMIIPNYLEKYYYRDRKYEEDRRYVTEEISDWLSEETGFCHDGFELVKEVTKESVEEELYDFFNDKMVTGDAPDIEGVWEQCDPANGNVIVIDCVGGKKITLIIQVD